MERNRSKNIFDDISRSSNGKIGREDVDAAMKGNADALFQKLNSDDRAKVQNLLNDREALQKVLKSDAAKAIMESLMKNGNKNG